MSKKAEATDAGPVREPGEPASSPLSAVTALMAERKQFEVWIAGLDARRDATPPAVFARVHADYTTRLEAVVGRLTSHVDGLRAELERLTTELESAHDQQQHARDARAEAELRAHVGELSADDWKTTAQQADERIDALISRHADLETELLRTRELLADAERPATPHLGSEAIPASAGAPARPVADAASPAPAEAVGDSAEATLHVPSGNATPGAKSPEVAAKAADQAQLLLDGPSASTAPKPPSARRGSASFDEMAFLNSVVETGAGARSDAAVPKAEGKGNAPAPARRDSFPVRASDIENADATADDSILNRPSPGPRPLAANISGNHPIVLRDKPAESVKTLKCSDCGAMNYPTEWYCEKCGAELASL